LRFEEQDLSSFAGLIVFQNLSARLKLSERLRQCFRHLTVNGRGPGEIARYSPSGVVPVLTTKVSWCGMRYLAGLRGKELHAHYLDAPQDAAISRRRLSSVIRSRRWATAGARDNGLATVA
jgi:hypothetical protein